MSPTRSRSRPPSTLSVAALVAAVLGVILLLAAPLGAAAHLWDFSFGFKLMRWSVYAGGLALVLAIAAGAWAFRRSSRSSLWLSVVALGLGLVTAGIPLSQYRTALTVPPINDITTNTASPPDFVAAGRGEENGAAGAPYPGKDFADAQRGAYPDVETLHFDRSPTEVFGVALEVARAMPGWQIVTADSTSGRIEATATTRWFRFKDDVVVKLTATASGTDVDLRSRSRVGQSDVGANATRIRDYSRRLKERLDHG
jgi:uncharacterized protein (DUF1499 family)